VSTNSSTKEQNVFREVSSQEGDTAIKPCYSIDKNDTISLVGSGDEEIAGNLSPQRHPKSTSISSIGSGEEQIVARRAETFSGQDQTLNVEHFPPLSPDKKIQDATGAFHPAEHLEKQIKGAAVAPPPAEAHPVQLKEEEGMRKEPLQNFPVDKEHPFDEPSEREDSSIPAKENRMADLSSETEDNPWAPKTNPVVPETTEREDSSIVAEEADLSSTFQDYPSAPKTIDGPASAKPEPVQQGCGGCSAGCIIS
jgi:hypothetical protein